MPDTVLIRLIYRGRIRWALPHWLVEETSDRVAIAIVPGVRCMRPETYGHGHYISELLSGWRLTEHEWQRNRTLRLTPFGAGYSLDLYWRDADDEFLGYQINLQEPLRQTRLGFDSFDQELDIVVTPFGEWRWKDVDSFEQGVRDGFVSAEDGNAIRELARALAGQISELIPTGWEDWRPDPAWTLPQLPPGWDANPAVT